MPHEFTVIFVPATAAFTRLRNPLTTFCNAGLSSRTYELFFAFLSLPLLAAIAPPPDLRVLALRNIRPRSGNAIAPNVTQNVSRAFPGSGNTTCIRGTRRCLRFSLRELGLALRRVPRTRGEHNSP